jgi:hypothetical protein
MALGTASVRGMLFVSETGFTSDDFEMSLCELAFTDPEIHQSLTCSIYEATPEKVLPALPQVVMKAVVQSQRFEYFGLSSLRSVLMHELGFQPSKVASQLVKSGSFLFTRTKMALGATHLICPQSTWSMISADCL